MTAERVIAALVAAFAGLLALVRAKRSAAFDLAMTIRLQGWEHPGPRRADAPRVVARLPAAVAAHPAGDRRGLVAAAAGAAPPRSSSPRGAARPSRPAIKAFIRRPRPLPPEVRVVVAPLGGTSFPSGHVLTYVAFYGFLGFLLAEHLRRRAAAQRVRDDASPRCSPSSGRAGSSRAITGRPTSSPRTCSGRPTCCAHPGLPGDDPKGLLARLVGRR